MEEEAARIDYDHVFFFCFLFLCVCEVVVVVFFVFFFLLFFLGGVAGEVGTEVVQHGGGVHGSTCQPHEVRAVRVPLTHWSAGPDEELTVQRCRKTRETKSIIIMIIIIIINV